MASTNTQSRILSIEEKIKQLQEKKKKEISKLESSVGKKFIEVFEVHNLAAQEIYDLIESLKTDYSSSKLTQEANQSETDNSNTNNKAEELS